MLGGSVPDILLGNNPLHSPDSCQGVLAGDSVHSPASNSLAPLSFGAIVASLKCLPLN